MLYADASALVKLFLAEEGSSEAQALVRGADIAATSILSYAELRAALAVAARANRINPVQHIDLVAALDALWHALFRVGIDQVLVTRAGDLAERFGLRGYDAVHLASLSTFAEPPDAALVCWDADLRKAGQSLGYAVLPG
jgi:uncharacterized protein